MKNFQPNPSPKSKLGWISKVFQTLANTKPCKHVTLGQHPLLICQPGSLIPRRDLRTFPTSSLWVNPFRLLISYTIRYAIGSWWPVLPALIPHRFSHDGLLLTAPTLSLYISLREPPMFPLSFPCAGVCLTPKFLHRLDRVLLLNWLACFLMESNCIFPLILNVIPGQVSVVFSE